MKKIPLIVFTCITLGVSLFGCSGNSSNSTTTEAPASTDSAASETEETTQTEVPSSEEEVDASEKAVTLAQDDVVNEFINSYNAITQSVITKVEKGNIRTKCFAYSYGYYLELLHANDTDKIDVTITQTNDNADAGMAGMRDVFRDVVAAIDSSLSSEDIEAYFDAVVGGGYAEAGNVLGSVLVAYSPDLELSGGHSRGHFDISAQ